MTGDPPVLGGAVQRTTTEPLPGLTVPSTGAPGVVRGVTGAEAARLEQFNLLSSRLHWTEGATVLLIVLIVGIALRAVLAPILTVLCAGLAFLISQHLLGWLAENSSLTMPNELQGVAVALMLGIVTDYSVFYFSSAREARGFAEWLDERFDDIKAAPESTTRTGKLQDIER